jgi:hypothetical protein
MTDLLIKNRVITMKKKKQKQKIKWVFIDDQKCTIHFFCTCLLYLMMKT